MELNDFLTAFALVLIIEGMVPFAAPNYYREAIRRLLDQDSRVIRIMGFASMLIGVVALYWVRT